MPAIWQGLPYLKALGTAHCPLSQVQTIRPLAFEALHAVVPADLTPIRSPLVGDFATTKHPYAFQVPQHLHTASTWNTDTSYHLSGNYYLPGTLHALFLTSALKSRYHDLHFPDKKIKLGSAIDSRCQIRTGSLLATGQMLWDGDDQQRPGVASGPINHFMCSPGQVLTATVSLGFLSCKMGVTISPSLGLSRGLKR